MSPDLSRRTFGAGLGAAIFAAALPPGVYKLAPRPWVLPRIALTVPTESYLTVDYLHRCIEDIYSQVAAMSGIPLNEADRDAIVENIDEVLWQIRPPGVQILIETPIARMISGNFTIREAGPGTVVIT